MSWNRRYFFLGASGAGAGGASAAGGCSTAGAGGAGCSAGLQPMNAEDTATAKTIVNTAARMFLFILYVPLNHSIILVSEENY
jgi:hypothetical protein